MGANAKTCRLRRLAMDRIISSVEYATVEYGHGLGRVVILFFQTLKRREDSDGNSRIASVLTVFEPCLAVVI